jgi:hypothetical protein
MKREGQQTCLRIIGTAFDLKAEARHCPADIVRQLDDSTCHPSALSFSTVAGSREDSDIVVF